VTRSARMRVASCGRSTSARGNDFKSQSAYLTQTTVFCPTLGSTADGSQTYNPSPRRWCSRRCERLAGKSRALGTWVVRTDTA
jgi:hypothetical protein